MFSKPNYRMPGGASFSAQRLVTSIGQKSGTSAFRWGWIGTTRNGEISRNQFLARISGTTRVHGLNLAALSFLATF